MIRIVGGSSSNAEKFELFFFTVVPVNIFTSHFTIDFIKELNIGM